MRLRPRHVAALALAAVSSATAQTPDPRNPAPAWTRGATCYEVFIRSFADGDGDGIGDLRGLTAKLDYINDGKPNSTRSLGARCIWLMPVAESPSYHGYDATDYYTVERDYGTNADFKRMVAAAHARGIKVLVDMVLNHSSNQHPYFQAALRDTASPYRSWYRFSKTKPEQTENIGNPPWTKSPVRDEYYYSIFWSGMPDLNYETPAVAAEANKIGEYWIQRMGVDGFRLDAVPYLVEDGAVASHTAGTHRVLRDYEAYLHSIKPDVYTIGEVTYPRDILMTYYPDQLVGYFAFEVADSLVSAVRTGSARNLLGPVLDLQQRVGANRYSPFLRNHDQTRTRTEFGGDLAKARLASFLLLTMPGMPFVYYGEEIGMEGAKPDERLRTPMQWTSAPGAGFTTGRPWERLADDSATVSVASAERDAGSILWLHRQLIHLRSTNPALGSGRLVPLTASTDAVAAYARRAGTRTVLVVANLGDTPATAVSLGAAAASLPAGRWTPRAIVGAASAGPLTVGKDGSVSAYTLPTLAPHEGYVFELRAK
jgi:alpha-amylase